MLSENFNDGDINGWVVVNEPGRTSCSAPWIVENGELLIEINQESCTKHLMPTDTLWNNLGDEYQIEVDMRSGGGTDHNIAFRVTMSQPDINNWYDYHFIYPSGIVLERVPVGTSSNSVSYPLSHNTTYHLTILVKTGNIKLSINDAIILDYHYDPEQDRFPTGRFAFRASTGSNPYSKTYFDNLVIRSLDELLPPSPSPSPTPSPSPSPSPSPTPNPVVILPGMGGSWNTLALITGSTGNAWKKTPFIKIYDNLKNTFLNAGYTENQDYFEFYYDWRKRVENLADDLNNYLGIVLNNQPPKTKVDLVGHSLGGLIARAYAQKYGVEKIDNLVTTGSPHEGAAPAYLAWAGAAMDESFSWESIGLELYLHLHQGRYSSPVIAVQNLSPSLKDMLPIFDFAKHSDDTIIPVNSMQTVNDYLVELKENLNSGLTDLMTTIAGSEKETVEWIKLGDRSVSDRLLNRWLDGRPTGYDYTNDGDGTVLSKSALIENTNQETVSDNHMDLVQTQTGIDAIMATLDIDTPAQIGNEQPSRNPSLLFLLHSPAEITVTDPNGGQAGFGVDKPITNSFYSQEDKLLLIYNALAGEYQTTITGTDNGSYQLEIGQLTNNGNYWSSLVDEIQTASTDVWTVNFDSQNPLSDPVVDQSGISKIDQAKLRLERLKSQTNRKLANYLNKIIKLLDKRQNLSALRLALTSTYKFRYWIDRFGQSNTSLKDEADQIGQLLNQALVTVGQNSRQKLTKKQTGAELRTAQLTKERVEDGAEKINGINLPLGNTLDLMNRYFDRAQTSFDQTKYWQTHADALVVRVLAIEANALIK